MKGQVKISMAKKMTDEANEGSNFFFYRKKSHDT